MRRPLSIANRLRALSPLCVFQTPAYVVSVYDADTVRLNVQLLWRGLWMMDERTEPGFRLYGIQAPEMRGATLETARVARDALRARILHKTVAVQSIQGQRDPRGRPLIVMHDDAGCINDWLVREGHAVLYLP